MEKKKIERINELSRLARQRELTAAEQTERAKLRAEYLEEFRRGAEQTLANTYIQYPDGSRRKLEKKKGK